MSEYAVIYEQGPASWGAWVPDLPGCVAAGKSRDEVEQLIVEAIKAHIESLREHGEPVPEPASTAGAVQVSAALSDVSEYSVPHASSSHVCAQPAL